MNDCNLWPKRVAKVLDMSKRLILFKPNIIIYFLGSWLKEEILDLGKRSITIWNHDPLRHLLPGHEGQGPDFQELPRRH